MGCSNAKSTYVSSDIVLENSASLEASSAISLQHVLEQPFLNESFRDFISTQWVPNNKEKNSYYKFEAKSIALSFLEFW